MQNALLGGSILLAVAIVGLLLVAGWGWWQFRRIDRLDVNLQRAGLAQPQNFLLVGSDTRDIDDSGPDRGGIFGKDQPTGQRADTIVVARIDPTRSSIELLSVPRDLWVVNSATGKKGKINAAYKGGAQQLVDTVSDNLGIPIHHYVEVNFVGFKGLVEAMGGVELYFDRPVRDRNTGLNIRKKGCYNLDGVQALAFARSRHLVYSNGVRWVSDPTADMGRITRQQIFLRHALGKAATLGISDLGTVRRLVGVAVDNVKIDNSLSADDLISLARKFAKFDAETLVTHRLVTEPDTTPGGEAVLRLDKAANTDLIAQFNGENDSEAPASPTTTSLPRSAVTVDVLNASGVSGEAKRTSDALTEAGFTAGEVGNAPASSKTVVRYSREAKEAAQLVASAMSPAPALEVDPSLSGATVQLILGPTHGDVVAKAPAGSTSSAGAGGGSTSAGPTTTVDPADSPVGLQIGDPPPGVKCG